MNKIHIIGNVTADPKDETTSTGKRVARFTVAVNRGWGDSKQTDFFRCTAWEKRAETILKYLHKGNKISVVGAVTARAYTANGEARASLEISSVEDFEFLTAKQEQTEQVPDGFTPVQEDLPW